MTGRSIHGKYNKLIGQDRALEAVFVIVLVKQAQMDIAFAVRVNDDSRINGELHCASIEEQHFFRKKHDTDKIKRVLIRSRKNILDFARYNFIEIIIVDVFFCHRITVPAACTSRKHEDEETGGSLSY